MPCTKAGLLTNLGVILILTSAFVESWHRPRPSRQFRKQPFVIFKLYRSQGKASLFITSLSTSSSFRLWYFLPCPMVEPSWHVHHRICYHWTHTHSVYITLSWVKYDPRTSKIEKATLTAGVKSTSGGIGKDTWMCWFGRYLGYLGLIRGESSAQHLRKCPAVSCCPVQQAVVVGRWLRHNQE